MPGYQVTNTNKSFALALGPICVLTFNRHTFHPSDAQICELLNKFWELLGPLDQSRYHPDTKTWELCLKIAYKLSVCRSGEIVKLSLLYLTQSVVTYTQCCYLHSVL